MSLPKILLITKLSTINSAKADMIDIAPSTSSCLAIKRIRADANITNDLNLIFLPNRPSKRAIIPPK